MFEQYNTIFEKIVNTFKAEGEGSDDEIMKNY